MKNTSNTHVLDATDWKILVELQENARISYAELARRVGLSTPAAAERVRRLEEADVISGYRAEVNPAKVGLPVMAFIRVNVVGDALPKFVKKAMKCPEVLEVHRVTGAESFIIKVAVEDHEHLTAVIDSLMPYVATTTSIILNSAVSWRCITPRQQG